MRSCDVWKNVSDAEFDNAMEGIEKLVMNRLYDLFVPLSRQSFSPVYEYFLFFSFSTFTPQVARADPPRPITTDDLEKDRVLSQRIALFGWLEEKHLDIPVGEGSKGFLMFAQQGQAWDPGFFLVHTHVIVPPQNCSRSTIIKPPEINSFVYSTVARLSLVRYFL